MRRPPIRIRVMGEDLVAFRDPQGRVLARHPVHAALAFGCAVGDAGRVLPGCHLARSRTTRVIADRTREHLTPTDVAIE